MFNYLNTIIIPMLKHLRKFNSSFPTECTDAAQWEGILTKMIEGFETSERMADWEYLGTPEEQKAQWEKDKVLFENNMKLFSKYYLALWD